MNAKMSPIRLPAAERKVSDILLALWLVKQFQSTRIVVLKRMYFVFVCCFDLTSSKLYSQSIGTDLENCPKGDLIRGSRQGHTGTQPCFTSIIKCHRSVCNNANESNYTTSQLNRHAFNNFSNTPLQGATVRRQEFKYSWENLFLHKDNIWRLHLHCEDYGHL